MLFFRDFQLSLNKRDAFENESETLAELGLVAGDLVHIINCTEESNFSSNNNAKQTNLASSKGIDIIYA